MGRGWRRPPRRTVDLDRARRLRICGRLRVVHDGVAGQDARVGRGREHHEHEVNQVQRGAAKRREDVQARAHQHPEGDRDREGQERGKRGDANVRAKHPSAATVAQCGCKGQSMRRAPQRGDTAGARPHLPSHTNVCEPCQFCQTFCSWAADVMCSASMRSGCSRLYSSSLEAEIAAACGAAGAARDGLTLTSCCSKCVSSRLTIVLESVISTCTHLGLAWLYSRATQLAALPATLLTTCSSRLAPTLAS